MKVPRDRLTTLPIERPPPCMHSVKVMIHLVCGCLGSLAFLIPALVLFIRLEWRCTKTTTMMNGLVLGWKSDKVFDITADPNYALPSSDFYLQRWNGLWPGTSEDCHCFSSRNPTRYTPGFSEGFQGELCSREKQSIGCNQIPSTPRRDLNQWTNGQQLFAVKARNTSFLDTDSKMDASGNCKTPAFTHCGDPSSKSKGVCLPAKLGRCPLTDITNSSQADYNISSFIGFNLYTSQKNDKNPIADASIRESHLCFARDATPLTDGREKYPPLLGNFTRCKKDRGAWAVGEMRERSFFELNELDITSLAKFNTSDDFKVRLLLSRGSEISPSCNHVVSTILEKISLVEDTCAQFILHRALVITAFTISLISLLRFAVAMNKRLIFMALFFGLRIAGFGLAMAVVCILFSRYQSVPSYLVNVFDLDCLDQNTSDSLADLKDSVKDLLVLRLQLILGLLVGGFVLEILDFAFLMYCRPKEDPSEVSPSR